MLARLSCCAALLMLAACAAAMPGYTPPPFKEKSKFSQALKSGDVDTAGHYEMVDQEKAMDCKRTTGSIVLTIERMKYRNTEVGTSNLATAANKTAVPIFGGSKKGLDRDAEYARERAKLAAYNRHLASKNCRTVDIEAELARPPEPAGKKY